MKKSCIAEAISSGVTSPKVDLSNSIVRGSYICTYTHNMWDSIYMYIYTYTALMWLLFDPACTYVPFWFELRMRRKWWKNLEDFQDIAPFALVLTEDHLLLCWNYFLLPQLHPEMFEDHFVKWAEVQACCF